MVPLLFLLFPLWSVSASELYTQRIDKFMEDLALCESGGNPDAINPDDGGSASKGVLQFKDTTFAAFMKKYKAYVPAGDIWNPGTQTALARYMILTPKGWKHWYNCSMSVGLLPHMIP